jgi:hypothetical protein
MKQIYFVIILFVTFIIGMLSINLEVTFSLDKNETLEINKTPLITTSELYEAPEINNTPSDIVNDTSIIEKIIP